ncbi:MAG: hypothetical protein KGS72_28875 [Cyanobacteria bacterium REEB67]|nr:hypothetical protein [Cyanobacteria bacterium REEB67]
MEIVYLIIAVAVVLFLFSLTSPRASMGSRSSFARADDLIMKAESRHGRAKSPISLL